MGDAASPSTWVVVTRPEREAARWVQALQALGLAAVPLPLMAFGPPTDPGELARAWQAVPKCDAVMFVSPQAVHAFWEASPPGFLKLFWPIALSGINKSAIYLKLDRRRAGSDADADADASERSGLDAAVRAHRLRCWAPGPGTAQALRQWGVPPESIDQPTASAAQFDSEALWPVVQAGLHPGMRVLVVRGESDAAAESISSTPAAPAAFDVGTAPPRTGNGREWLVRQCEAAGVEVLFCVAYRRQPPQWGPPQQALAQQALATGAVWLLSSSESLGYLQQLLPAASWQGATALATHPRIAQAALDSGFGRVWQSRPALADVAAVLRSHLAPL